MEKIRAIIVDDEKPARRRLRELLEKRPDIAIGAERSNGAEAVRKILALQPDLLLSIGSKPRAFTSRSTRPAKPGCIVFRSANLKRN